MAMNIRLLPALCAFVLLGTVACATSGRDTAAYPPVDNTNPTGVGGTIFGSRMTGGGTGNSTSPSAVPRTQGGTGFAGDATHGTGPGAASGTGTSGTGSGR
jgi:hypothetical protein